ncbi:[LysW]-aminoadipate semialdehyde transaminase [bacterium HR17]|uniref:[LysW]-aminoadipate semialdehyde transaminase n=1 Tax=Candidatus Fervidibacter japonicus TaxID=2035412 RepID=A0A2H5XB74_9BACT|nr:[LysW]-aminoadipate semialdehyde transaminase [bacterium HR17]
MHAMATLREKFLRYLAQTSDEPIGIVVERTEGCWVIAKDGRRYLDFISGIAVTNIGHRRPEVVDAVKRQVDRYWHAMVYGEFVQDVQVALAEKLVGIVEAAFRRASGGRWQGELQYYPTNSGTEANEGALKLARKFTGRKKFVAFHDSFHGDTMGSLSVTGREVYRRPFEPLLPDVTFLPFGDVAALERIDATVAAVIVEPIQGEAGIIVPPDDFLPALRQRCDEVGALLILDEVQTGFGRTGKWFAFEHWGIVPDILTVGKALGGGMPLSGFLARREVMRALAENPPLCHVTTFGGHPVCCAAALAALEVMERDCLPQRAAEIGAKLQKALKDLVLRFPTLREVRGKGLMLGLEFADKLATRAFVRRCLQRGLIVGGTLHTEKVVRIAPPLVIGDDELAMALGIMVAALQEGQ